MTIKRKMLIMIICFVILPMLFLPIITTLIYGNILERKVNDSTQQSLAQIANNLDGIIDSMVTSSEILCNDKGLINILIGREHAHEWEKFYEWMDVQNKMQSILDTTLNQYNASVTLVSLNGIVYSTSKEISNLTYKEIIKQSWFKQTTEMDGHILWFGPAGQYAGLAEEDNFSYIAMTRLVKDYINGSCGVLIISLYPEAKKGKLFTTGSQERNIKIFLLNDKNIVILANDKGMTGNNIGNKSFVHKLNGARGSITDVIENNKTIINYYSISKPNWKIVQLIPYDFLLKETKQLQWYNIIVNLLFMAALILVSIFISWNIANPLHKLSQLMVEVPQGNFNVRISVKGNNEIARLGRSFNVMVEGMEKLINELHEVYETREKLRLEALRAQINPHFLLNTLNSIKWMGVVHGEAKSSQMIAALSSLMGAILYSDDELIPLSDEIKYLESYITLQKMRFGDKFDIRFAVPEDLLDFKIPGLLLQPMVENSIIHGFEEIDSGGLIIVSGIRKEDEVIIEVCDNGKGISSKINEGLLNAPNRGKGRFSNIGLKNVNDRILYRYGSKYGLKIISGEGEGTTIQLRLPAFEGEKQGAEAYIGG